MNLIFQGYTKLYFFNNFIYILLFGILYLYLSGKQITKVWHEFNLYILKIKITIKNILRLTQN